jgi:hypothetical protein
MPLEAEVESLHASSAAFLRPQPSSLRDHQHPAGRDRARLFDSERFKRKFVTRLADLRGEPGFRIVGYVLIRQLTDCHLLLCPSDAANPTQIMRRLEERTAQFILKNLRQNLEYPWRQKMFARVTLPPSVHDHAHFRVWQRGLYDASIRRA